jgi:HSP20 family molecular chaperone IbpA
MEAAMKKQHSNAAKRATQRQKQAPEKHIARHNKPNIDLVSDNDGGRGRKNAADALPKAMPPEPPHNTPAVTEGASSNNSALSRNNATVLSPVLFPRQVERGIKSAPSIDLYPLFKYTWQFWAGVINPWYLFMPFLKLYQKPQSQINSSQLNSARNYALKNLKSESWETETGYFYEVDLPGVGHEQIMLGFHNGAIMLRVEELDNSKGYWHPHFLRRAFIPPVYINAEGINARLQNGKLVISIPKAERPSSRQSRLIEVT